MMQAWADHLDALRKGAKVLPFKASLMPGRSEPTTIISAMSDASSRITLHARNSATGEVTLVQVFVAENGDLVMQRRDARPCRRSRLRARRHREHAQGKARACRTHRARTDRRSLHQRRRVRRLVASKRNSWRDRNLAVTRPMKRVEECAGAAEKVTSQDHSIFVAPGSCNSATRYVAYLRHRSRRRPAQDDPVRSFGN